MDRLKHFHHNFDLGFGNNRENIAVEMGNAALVSGIRKHFSRGLQHSHTLVADDELHTVQAASTKSYSSLVAFDRLMLYLLNT